MDEKKSCLHFKEKYFDNEIDFFNWVAEWTKIPLTEEEADQILDNLKKDIVASLFLTTEAMDNGQFSHCVEKIFDYAMKVLREESDK
jgi:hypothetical protein